MAACDISPDEVPATDAVVDGYPSGKTAGKQQSSQNAKYTRQGNPEMGRLTGREEAFQELGDLTALYEGLSAKTRQHVNPLADHFQVPTAPPDWSLVFEDPTLPLHVDVGCGSGRFVLIRAQRLAGRTATDITEDILAEDCAADDDKLAAIPVVSERGTPQANVLGMEIRRVLVVRAEEWTKRLQLRNCHFIFTNATVSWKSLLSTYPGRIELVSMQFPDPHFKTRHHKRRHVQPQLCRELAETMPSGARVFLQGDVPEAVRWMRDMIETHSDGCFDLAPECREQGVIREEWQTMPDANSHRDAEVKTIDNGTDELSQEKQDQLPLLWSADASAGWLAENPLGVPSEREVYVAQIKATVYRVMLRRL